MAAVKVPKVPGGCDNQLMLHTVAVSAADILAVAGEMPAAQGAENSPLERVGEVRRFAQTFCGNRPPMPVQSNRRLHVADAAQARRMKIGVRCIAAGPAAETEPGTDVRHIRRNRTGGLRSVVRVGRPETETGTGEAEAASEPAVAHIERAGTAG